MYAYSHQTAHHAEPTLRRLSTVQPTHLLYPLPCDGHAHDVTVACPTSLGVEMQRLESMAGMTDDQAVMLLSCDDAAAPALLWLDVMTDAQAVMPALPVM